MPLVNFAEHSYVPVLAGDEVSQIAFEQLSVECKNRILPLFELTRHRTAADFTPSVELVAGLQAPQFLVDLDKRVAPAPYQSRNPSDPIAEAARVQRETVENNAFNVTLSALLDPADGFRNWRAIVGELPESVPILQYTNPGPQANAIMRQAALLLNSHERIAIRIQRNQSELVANLAVQILAIAPSSAQVLLILDCGQARRNYLERAEWAADTIALITNELDRQQIANLEAVCMSNSYPQPNHDGLRIADNYDREVWVEACDEFPFLFGDYAASHKVSSLSAFKPRSFRATVVHTVDERWLIHRDDNSDDPEGWTRGCEVIAASDSFDPIDSRTDERIAEVAQHGLDIGERPRDWHALRVSGHIERQSRIVDPEDLDD